MNNLPKKIYLDLEDFTPFMLAVLKFECPDHIPYVRADLVDGLVKSLELLLNQFDSEIHSEYDGTSLLERRLAEADHARLALKALEEE